MVLSYVIFLGLLILFSRGSSILSYFVCVEILFFLFIYFLGVAGQSKMFLWGLVLAVGASVLILTLLVSSMIFFGSDSQSTFLD